MELGLVLRWLLLYGVLFALALPTTRYLFRGAPDDGAGFAVPTAFVIVTLAAFYIGHVRFGPWTALASVGVLLAVGAAAQSRVAADLRSLASVPVAESFAAFLLGFGVLLAFRASAPGITPAGGEQFLHFGVFRATMRAEALPPEDVWFAGESLRYYFGLPVFNSVLALLADTAPRYAFNLVLPGYYGALVASAYSLSGWLAADRGYSRRLGGALGAFFVAGAGNLAPAVRLLFGRLPHEVAVRFGEAVFGAIRHIDYETAIREQGSVAEWSWFFSRYVVPETLQEFPLYSFVKADIHGHTVTTSLLVLTAALAYALARTPACARWRRRGLAFVALPLVGGYFGVTNTWSLPTVAGLTWLALALGGPHPASLLPAAVVDRLGLGTGEGDRIDLASADPGTLAAELGRTALAAVLAAVVAGLSAAVAAPFLLGNTPRNDGVGLLPPRTEAAGLLLLWGGFLALFGLYLATRRRPLGSWRPREAGVALAVAAGIVGLAWLVGDLAAFVLVGPPVVAGWVLVRSEGDAGFETVLLVAGLGLVLAMELVHARVVPENLDRWNTTLKVAIQAWTLCGVAAGPIAAILLGSARDALATARAAAPTGGGSAGTEPAEAETTALERRVRDRRRPRTRNTPNGSVLGSLAVVALVGTVLLTGGVFGVLATGDEVGAAWEGEGIEDATIDGLAVWETHRPAELAAITWLDGEASRTQSVLWMDRKVGTPTVLEAPGRRPYHWQNPASTFTGLPTVAGWAHEEGYRGEAAYTERVDDAVVVLYDEWNGTDRLRDHDVRYVYVGPVERDRYGDEMTDFAADPRFELVYETEAVRIYRVDRDALGGSSAAGSPAVA